VEGADDIEGRWVGTFEIDGSKDFVGEDVRVPCSLDIPKAHKDAKIAGNGIPIKAMSVMKSANIVKFKSPF